MSTRLSLEGNKQSSQLFIVQDLGAQRRTSDFLNPTVSTILNSCFKIIIMEVKSETLSPVTRYRYPPLPDGSTRLLSMTRIGVDGEPIFDLFHVAFNELPDFYALSYVWGSALRSCAISCNGGQLQVTQSLFQALTGLKSKILSEGIPIWIDAVCIDQENEEEKCRQVSNMHCIYQQAKDVLVWLGPEEDNSNLAMEGVLRLAEVLDFKSIIPTPDRLPEYGLPAKDDSVWPALGCLFSRPWVFRLWTFQEIVLAKNASVYCGDAMVEWVKFEVVGYGIHQLRLWALTLSKKTEQIKFRGFSSVANIAIMRRNVQYNPDLEQNHEEFLNFSRILPLAQSKQCTEPRDRAYAILSLTTQQFRDRVSVDYKIPLRSLYIKCGKACLEQDASLQYLKLLANQKRKPDLPSWCLDLQPRELAMIFGGYLRAGLREASKPSNRAKIVVLPDSNDIKIHGSRVDIVEQIVPMDFIWPHQKMPQDAKRVVEWEATCQSLARRTLGQHESQTPIDHVCTLSATFKAHYADFDALARAYQDQITHLTSQGDGKGNCIPPPERMSAFDYFWVQMADTCAGRTYFSTSKGRVGIGPPQTQIGDLVAVIYGAEPVFLLRRLPSPDARAEIVGDAFVHGLMDLRETPKEALEPAEWFIIC